MKNKSKKELFELLKQKMVRGNSLKTISKEMEDFRYEILWERMRKKKLYELIDELVSLALIKENAAKEMKEWFPNISYKNGNEDSIYLLEDIETISDKIWPSNTSVFEEEFIEKFTDGVGSRYIPIHRAFFELLKIREKDILKKNETVICWLSEKNRINKEVIILFGRNSYGDYYLGPDMTHQRSFLWRREEDRVKEIKKK